MDNNKKWFVVYSKPRWEKKVALLFDNRNISNYCPINIVSRKWSDRIKKVEVPLFTSYIFVHITDSEKTKVRETDGVINFVYFEGKPAIVRDEEIERIKKFLNENEDIELEAGTFKKGEKVIVDKGLFIEKDGRIIDLKNNKVKVEIESLGYTLVATFDRSRIVRA